MSRVSTTGNYQSALMDLMASQTRMAEAQKKIATQKNATDLVGFGRQSETLTAMKGSMARLQSFIDTGETVSARLTTQDLAMNRVNDALTDLAVDSRQAVDGFLRQDLREPSPLAATMDQLAELTAHVPF